MSICTSIDPLVTPYVDGELSALDRARVDEHLQRCPPCHARVAAEGAMRQLVRSRQGALTAERASASLRARCGEAVREAPPRSRAAIPLAPSWRRLWVAPWRGGLAPFALTASLVLLVAGAFLSQATRHSSRLLAAELAADHVKCFAANSLLGTHHESARVESSMLSAFGWHLSLPEELGEAGLELVGSRQCLYGEGRIAHLMYEERGRAVSIFMLPGRARAEELVEVLGHEAAIWSSGDRTFVLVTRGSRDEAQHMASLVKAVLQ